MRVPGTHWIAFALNMLRSLLSKLLAPRCEVIHCVFDDQCGVH